MYISLKNVYYIFLCFIIRTLGWLPLSIKWDQIGRHHIIVKKCAWICLPSSCSFFKPPLVTLWDCMYQVYSDSWSAEWGLAAIGWALAMWLQDYQLLERGQSLFFRLPSVSLVRTTKATSFGQWGYQHRYQNENKYSKKFITCHVSLVICHLTPAF